MLRAVNPSHLERYVISVLLLQLSLSVSYCFLHGSGLGGRGLLLQALSLSSEPHLQVLRRLRRAGLTRSLTGV